MVCFLGWEQGKDEHISWDEQDERETKDHAEGFWYIINGERDDDNAPGYEKDDVNREFCI